MTDMEQKKYPAETQQGILIFFNSGTSPKSVQAGSQQPYSSFRWH
jgi:hypothetical protein